MRSAGYSDGEAAVNLTPSGFQWFGIGSLNTTTFSPDTPLTLAAGQLDPNTLTLQAFQNVRTGVTVNLTEPTSDPASRSIVTSPLLLATENNFGSTTFHPVASGATYLVI